MSGFGVAQGPGATAMSVLRSTGEAGTLPARRAAARSAMGSMPLAIASFAVAPPPGLPPASRFAGSSFIANSRYSRQHDEGRTLDPGLDASHWGALHGIALSR